MGRDVISVEKLKKWRDQMLRQSDRRLDGAVTVDVWSQACAPPREWLEVNARQSYIYLSRMEAAGLIRRFQGKECKPQLWEVLPKSGLWRDRSSSDVVLDDKELGVEYVRLPWYKHDTQVEIYRCLDCAAGRLESKLPRFAGSLDDPDGYKDPRGEWITYSKVFKPGGPAIRIPAEKIDEQVAELVETDLDRLRRGEQVLWWLDKQIEGGTGDLFAVADWKFMKHASLEEIARRGGGLDEVKRSSDSYFGG